MRVVAVPGFSQSASAWHPVQDAAPDLDIVALEVPSGRTFADTARALGEAGLLPPSDLALLAIGERSGALAEVLRELADVAEETRALRGQILAGLALPAFNLLSACFIVPLPALVLGGSTARYLLSALLPPLVLAAIGFGIECTTARSRLTKKSGLGSASTERITPPAIRKPKAWMG